MNINETAAIKRVMDLISLRGGSGCETAVSEYLRDALKSAGVPASSIIVDTANRHSPIGGATGNLIVKLKGTKRGPRRMLMAHMDTVPLAVDSQPVRNGDWIRPKSTTTALGADDRAGCAVVLSAFLELLKQKIDYPPLTLLFTIQEEIGLCGARHVSAKKLGKPELCFNWDGRDPGDLIVGAVGATNLDIQIDGIPSHAGVHPDDGVNAAVVAAIALTDLQENGWHGLVVKGKRRGTSNIGSIDGGAATNVVMPSVRLTAEARSHSPAFRERIVREFHKAFQKAVPRVMNSRKQTAQLKIEEDTRYNAFTIPKKSPSVLAAIEAVREAGLDAQVSSCDGGLDANWMSAHGFPTVTLGCGQHHIHTVDERLHIPQYLQALEIACRIASGASSED
jgi:tripeptide aminopeptidase